MVKLRHLNRRQFLWTTGLGSLSVAMSRAPELEAAQDSSEVQAIAEDAYIWGFPLLLMKDYFELASHQNYEPNRFTLSIRLSTAQDRVAIGPNVDTLYGFAWLDLANGPQILHVPDTGGRYYSIQLIDGYANTFTYVGRRVTGTKEAEYAIVGPGWEGTVPPRVKRVDAPTKHVLALTRTLVSGSADLPAAQDIQLQYTLRALRDYSNSAAAPLTTTSALNVFPILNLAARGPVFFDDLGVELASSPPPAEERGRLLRFGSAGIGPNRRPSVGADQQTLTSLHEAVSQADDRIRKANYSTQVNGWSVNYKITNFIKDPLLRASSNRLGPGAHVAQEALYFFTNTGPDEKPLTGAGKYRLRFPSGQLPPVDAFWSLILYGSDFFLVQNPINRYSIGDRTEGLTRGSDGSLEIRIQREPSEQGTNWLPAPEGGFQLILRTYQPKPALFNGEYKLPALEYA
jgi:hypothetical protein